MSSFDRESFHLLPVSDTASDSVPDLDLVIPNIAAKKKKVRLKRWVHFFFVKYEIGCVLQVIP